MKIVNYFDESFKNTNDFLEFKNLNPGIGRLKIRAFAANEALPVSNVHVVVSCLFHDMKIVFFDGVTDASGMTSVIELPTPRTNSDDLIVPEAINYEVESEDVEMNNKQSFVVKMYNGICVVQNIIIVPNME
ncbi:MAG: hypothetical protein IJ715_03405 [Bacilli bacterium]|nr:hypothetical protein [Bacilli bacterium]MBR1936097.1 hypothetical protein [Bacilli bacterium]